jgi:intracellular septation protein A
MQRDPALNPLMPFLTQLLPLLAFLVVDAFVTDVRISIAVAIAFAVVQLLVTWARARRFDWFVVLDVVLIAGLGGLSIALEDEFFFKLKPAIIEGVSVVVMLALVFAPARFLLAYLGRMVPNGSLGPEAVGMMKQLLWLMCACTVVHIALVLYTAVAATKETWAFVSGPGFYLCLLPLGAYVLRARRSPRKAP